MNQAKEARERRFISIYRKHVDEVYQYVLLRTGFDVPLAEDLTQDIFSMFLKGYGVLKDCPQKKRGFSR